MGSNTGAGVGIFRLSLCTLDARIVRGLLKVLKTREEKSNMSH